MTFCEAVSSSSSSGAMAVPGNAPLRCPETPGGTGLGSCDAAGASSTKNCDFSEGVLSDMRHDHAMPQHSARGWLGLGLHGPRLPSATHTPNLSQGCVSEQPDPLPFFLSNGGVCHDPFGFGLGSVADGNFSGRQPACEQLLLLRSHRLLQAEAISVAVGKGSSSNSLARQRFCAVSTSVARQLRTKIMEATDATAERLGALGLGASPRQHDNIINMQRSICLRHLAGILDSATSALKEISGSSSSAGGSEAGIRPGAAIESALELDGGIRQNLSPFMRASPHDRSQGVMRAGQHEYQHHQQSIMHTPAAIGRSSIFALNHNHVRDRSQDHAGLETGRTAKDEGGPQSAACLSEIGPFRGGLVGSSIPTGDGEPHAGGCAMPSTPMRFDHGGVSASTPTGSSMGTGGDVGHGDSGGGKQAMSASIKAEKRKRALLTKTSAGMSENPRSTYNNRKGSRHRLTPQAKEILESWLAKHWLNPYPTEEEKVFLAQACHITVTQVNNWMMNVRVRRCRTKKIGVATGPEQITYPSTAPRAIAADKAKARARRPLTSAAFRGTVVPRKETGGRVNESGKDRPLPRMGERTPRSSTPPRLPPDKCDIDAVNHAQPAAHRLPEQADSSPHVAQSGPCSAQEIASDTASDAPPTPWALHVASIAQADSLPM